MYLLYVCKYFSNHSSWSIDLFSQWNLYLFRFVSRYGLKMTDSDQIVNTFTWNILNVCVTVIHVFVYLSQTWLLRGSYVEHNLAQRKWILE